MRIRRCVWAILREVRTSHTITHSAECNPAVINERSHQALAWKPPVGAPCGRCAREENQVAVSKRMKWDEQGAGASRTAQRGRSILEKLAPSLHKRGVPSTSYIVVNTTSGDFVTGKTREEARERFKGMHPGAKGWMQRFGDVSVVSGEYPQDARSPDVNGFGRRHDANPQIARR